MPGGFMDHYGDPTDSRGRRWGNNRLNLERMASLGLDDIGVGELYSSRSRGYGHSRDSEWVDDPSNARERYTRGYNPNYYGVKAPHSVSSAPERGDMGYCEEDLKNHPEGCMTNEYDSYKHASRQSDLNHTAYSDTRRAAPKRKPEKQVPGYYGDDFEYCTTRDKHRELRDLAMQSASSSALAAQQRDKFDLDYVGHYRDNTMRKGHIEYARRLGHSHDAAEKRALYHNRYCSDEDSASNVDHNRY